VKWRKLRAGLYFRNIVTVINSGKIRLVNNSVRVGKQEISTEFW